LRPPPQHSAADRTVRTSGRIGLGKRSCGCPAGEERYPVTYPDSTEEH
jgi:hypothetical protein